MKIVRDYRGALRICDDWMKIPTAEEMDKARVEMRAAKTTELEKARAWYEQLKRKAV